MTEIKNPVIITVLSNPDAPGFKQLERSAKHFGWEFHPIICEWKGFGTKVIETRRYLQNNPNIKSFVFLDAYDTFVLGTREEFMYKNDIDSMSFSAEKNCWPDRKYMGYVHPHEAQSDWMYLNSGSYYAKTSAFLLITGDCELGFDDQRYFTEKRIIPCCYVRVELDYLCRYFQSIAFEVPGDFEFRWERLFNLKTRTFPIFIHGNGKTDMTKIYGLIP